MQIAGSTPLDVIVISEILPKAPNATVTLSLITLPGNHCYLNFDHNNYDPISSDIRGVGIYVHHKLQASQVFFYGVPFVPKLHFLKTLCFSWLFTNNCRTCMVIYEKHGYL